MVYLYIEKTANNNYLPVKQSLNHLFKPIKKSLTWSRPLMKNEWYIYYAPASSNSTSSSPKRWYSAKTAS